MPAIEKIEAINRKLFTILLPKTRSK